MAGFTDDSERRARIRNLNAPGRSLRRDSKREWRGPVYEVYPEAVSGFDLNNPDESFDDLLDQADEMPFTMARRMVDAASAAAHAAYGAETKKAMAGTPDRCGGESFRGISGRGRLVSLIAGHMLRADRYGVQSALTVEDWVRIRASHEETCAYCGIRTRNLTIDHYAPMSRGGTNTFDNVVGCCRACNVSKGAKDPIAWMRERGLDTVAAAERVAKARARQEEP